MKVIRLAGSGETYSSFAYLVLGDWNTLDDVNTLVDTGSDDSILAGIESASTGVGKRAVAQVVFTHSHFDHVGGTAAVKRRYGATVLSYTSHPLTDRILRDGDEIRMGDRVFEVIHTPGHSSDSICLYCPEERVLFSGDLPFRVQSPGGSYDPEFILALERLARLGIETVYSGHDLPLTGDIRAIFDRTIGIVKGNRA